MRGPVKYELTGPRRLSTAPLPIAQQLRVRSRRSLSKARNGPTITPLREPHRLVQFHFHRSGHATDLCGSEVSLDRVLIAGRWRISTGWRTRAQGVGERYFKIFFVVPKTSTSHAELSPAQPGSPPAHPQIDLRQNAAASRVPWSIARFASSSAATSAPPTRCARTPFACRSASRSRRAS